MSREQSLRDRAVGRREIGSSAGSSLPVYHQLHLILGQRIRDGHYPAGSAFPSELALTKQFGVSRVTVRRTLALLDQDGLVVRRRGVGTFVDSMPVDTHPITGMIDNLITLGLETEARLLSHASDPTAPSFVAGALGLMGGAFPVRFDRLRSHRGSPFSYSSIWLAPALAALIDPAELGDRTTVAALEKAGIQSTSAEQTITATLADHHVGALLEVPLGSALVRLRRTVRDADSAPVLFQQSLYRPDRYEYHMLLTRDQSASRPRWRHIG